MKTQIIQLERHDDLTVVVDKITWSKADRVLLVWPARGEILNRPLDLVLVQRACLNLGVSLACVAEDPDVLDQALELGIPVFRSARVAQRLPWRRRRRKKLLEAHAMQPRTALEELRHQTQAAGWPWLKRPAARVIFFILGVFSVLGLMVFLFPEASIDLPLVRSEQSMDLSVWAGPEITSMNLTGGIPAQVFSVVVEGQASQPATGSLNLPEKTGSGRIQFTNLTTQPVTVPAGTLIQTVRGPLIQYHTTQSVILSSTLGSTAEAPIEALQAGSPSNVAAGQLQAVVGEIGLKVTATNHDAISNGREGLNRTASDADWEALRARLLETLKEGAQHELYQKIDSSSRIILASVSMKKVVVEKHEPPDGTPTNTITLTLQAEYQAWIYDQSEVERLAQTVLDSNRPPEKMSIPGSFRVQPLAEPQITEGLARWNVRASQQLQPAWDERLFAQAVTGKFIESARQNLATFPNLIGPAQIHLTPEWWPFMPLLPGRIQVNLQ